MWGVHTIVDLFKCDPVKIRSKEALEFYLKEIVHKIEMKAFGQPIVVHFGSSDKVAGYTILQLIETSLISGHFVEADDSAHIDIFSCKEYDSESAAVFTADFFNAESFDYEILER